MESTLFLSSAETKWKVSYKNIFDQALILVCYVERKSMDSRI